MKKMPFKSVSDLARVVDRYLHGIQVKSPATYLLEKLFEVIYFASLKTEEGKSLQLRVALVDPANPDPSRPPQPRASRWKIIEIRKRIPFTVSNAVKLAKAADPWSSCLAVYYDSTGDPFIWGLVDQTVHFNKMLVRENDGGYSPPGVIHIIAAGSADLAIYREWSFIARLAQDTLLERQNDVFWSGPVEKRISVGVNQHVRTVLARIPKKVLAGSNPFTKEELVDKWISTLCRILISIHRYRHGGALLLTRSRADLDIKHSIEYSRLPKALVGLGTSRIMEREAREEIWYKCFNQKEELLPAKLYLEKTVAENYAKDFEDEIAGCVRFISSLSCIDGLILAAPDLSIRGFGVEIRTRKDVEEIYLSASPKLTKRSLRPVNPNHYGTRHRSMMRYCMAHPDSIGFVISQDGDIRAITKVGHRVVMWENLLVHRLFEASPKNVISSKSRKA